MDLSSDPCPGKPSFHDGLLQCLHHLSVWALQVNALGVMEQAILIFPREKKNTAAKSPRHPR